mgnify:CR=1 FL=1
MTKHTQKKTAQKAATARKTTTRAKKATKRTARKPRATKASKAKPTKPKPERDPRLPPAGTEIVRPYKGREIRVTVLEDGFRWEGEEYRSLTALAAKITGARSINGPLWFRLRDRKPASKKGETTRGE